MNNHILRDVYKFEETNGRVFDLVDSPALKTFSFDLESLSKNNNMSSSVFWNFGDPDDVINEITTKSIVQSTVNHIFKYEGAYKITSIANVNGVLYHLERNCIVGTNDVRIYPNTILTNTEFNITFKSFYETDMIYYTITESDTNIYSPLDINSSNTIRYNKFTSNIILDTLDGTDKYFTINFCAFTKEGQIINHNESYYTITYNIDKVAPIISWNEGI